MKNNKFILTIFFLTFVLFASNKVTAQTNFDPYKIIKDIAHDSSENRGAAHNYIHVINKTNDEIYVEYDHDIIKRKYYGTWAPKNGWGKAYRPYFQGLDYTIYIKEKGGSWSQHHKFVNCKKRSQLVTITKKNGDYVINVTDYKSK